MKQNSVVTNIEQDFTSAEKWMGRHNIDAISSADLQGYATETWTSDNFEPKIDYYYNDQGQITGINNSAIGGSFNPDELSGYATLDYVDQTFYSAGNPSGFLTSADLNGYATETWTSSNFEPAIDYYYDDQGQITGINNSAIGGSNSMSEIGWYERVLTTQPVRKTDQIYAYSDIDLSGTSALSGTLVPYSFSGFCTPEDVSGQINSAWVQSDWTQSNSTNKAFIKNKPGQTGLKAGYGIQFVDETSAVKINSNVPYPTVECHPISAEYSGAVLVIYPQSSACCEMHVTTPHRYDVASYSAKINDDVVYSISSGSWYEFVKQDWEGTQEWCFKDSGSYYA